MVDDFAADLAGSLGDSDDDDLETAVASEIDRADAAPAETPAESETFTSDLERALGEPDQAAARAAADQAWERELAEYAKPHRDALNAMGKGKRELLRRLCRTEAAIRERPGEVLPQLARDYLGQLDDHTRAGAAQAILANLGFESATAIDRQQAERLRYYESQAAAAQREHVVALQTAQQRVAEFAQGKPNFAQLRPVMSALMASAAAHDLEGAYRMAATAKGLSLVSPEEQAKAADAARRAAVLKAKGAQTPRTASRGGSAPDLGGSFGEDLAAALGGRG